MADSRIESAYESLIQSFKGITVANGYRNTVQNVTYGIRWFDRITVYPEIGLELGAFTIKPLGDARDTFDVVAPVGVAGWVRANTVGGDDPELEPNLYDASMSLVHDIAKLMATLLTANVNSSTNKWNVELSENELKIEPVMGLGEQRNVALLGCTFNIRVRALGGTFE